MMQKEFDKEKDKILEKSKLVLYNTLSRKKEAFAPMAKKEVGFYACGPTVYNFAHIGNLRTYIFEDVLKRALVFNNYNVKHIMNITDVGHLVGDADLGEDKMLLGAKREKKSVQQIAQFYTDAFKNDLRSLNILEPTIWCKATDHIQEMLETIKKIDRNGFTYQANGNVYFDVVKFNEKFKIYGKLANLRLSEEDIKSRVEQDENKKSRFDFVLWFTKSKFQDQEQKWDSPYGVGYPGWHIECSAMSTKYLGKEFDIHAGGIDHIPIHHTNEIAQCMAANGNLFARYWLHGEFLVLNKGKMSKSSGEFLTLSVLTGKGYDPLVYRYFCLNAHYRQQLQFSYEAMDGARNSYNNLKKKILELKQSPDGKKLSKEESTVFNEYLELFVEAINDDLNMPKALAVVWDMLKDLKLGSSAKLVLIEKFDEVFGLGLKDIEAVVEDIPSEISVLAEQRKQARQKKDFALSDKLRDAIKQKGYIIADEKNNEYKISKI